MSLDSRPARTDLTTRECAKLIGSTIGGLLEMAPLENIRQAVRWWAENDEAWQVLPLGLTEAKKIFAKVKPAPRTR